MGGASGQGSEKRRVTGRVKEPRSSFVCPGLSHEGIGGRGEEGKGSVIRDKIRTLLKWTVIGTAFGGMIWVGCCNFKKYHYYLSVHSEYKALL